MNNLLMNFNAETNRYEYGIFSIRMETIEALIGKLISCFIIIILMYVTIKLGNKAIDKFVERQKKSNGRFSMDSQKAITIGSVLKSVIKYTVYIVGVVFILIKLFGQGIVAAAGVGGIAIGFGAQSLVRDLINGIFILFEDQYGVGDHVTIGQFSGIIENIGIRTTTIRDFTGDLHLLPNGTITQVTNHSRGNMRFLVDVEIAYEEDIDSTIDLIKNVCSEFEEVNKDEITEKIEVLGVMSLNASGVTIRVVGRSKPLSQWKMERELRREIKLALDKAGIEIPYPKTQLIKSKEGQ